MARNDRRIGQEDQDSSRTLDAVAPLHTIGSSISRYMLSSVFGEGGFGIVCLAEQQHSVTRLVPSGPV